MNRDRAKRPAAAEPAGLPAVGRPARRMSRVQRRYGNATRPTSSPAQTGSGAVQLQADKEFRDRGELTDKDASARFEGDSDLEKVGSGGKKVGRGGRGLTVTKIQQALIDMGYLLPKYGVDGKFEGETAKAVGRFQKDEGIPTTCKLDEATLEHLHERFDTRKPYVGSNAKLDKADPDKGTRILSKGDAAAAFAAMEPKRGTGGASAVFQEVVGLDNYGDSMKARLGALIRHLHKDLYADKKDLRKDEAKNFHDWSVLEGTAKASKDVTDAVYGTDGPAMSEAAGTFVDQWTDEEERNKKLSPAQQRSKAYGKVEYLINSNCAALNKKHSAVPSDSKEQAILKPIIEGFVDTDAKVLTMLQIDTGWEGAQLEGTVYLQRFKQATAKGNRAQLWEIFHTCIHEYLHSLAATDYKDYAQSLADAGDNTRYNTLIEGFCDFFTLNVRSTISVDEPLRKKVEGPYYDAAEKAPNVRSGVYPSHQQAEQVVSIVGIHNAQAAYFFGDVEKIGGKKATAP